MGQRVEVHFGINIPTKRGFLIFGRKSLVVEVINRHYTIVIQLKAFSTQERTEMPGGYNQPSVAGGVQRNKRVLPLMQT